MSNNTGNKPNMYSQIRDISEAIKKLKTEVFENLPTGVVPEATQELDAVVKATEDATNRILDAAEKIRETVLTIGDAAAVNKIDKEIINIFEACNFQDITGQRIKKVTAVLHHIETSIAGLLTGLDKEGGSTHKSPSKAKTIDELTDKDLMNGPQLDEKAPNQGDIDKLFDSL